MKINETITHQDGTTSTREFNMELSVGRGGVAYSLYPTDGEPICIWILKSGWKDQYHVVTEYGGFDSVSHSLITTEKLLETYPEFSQVLNAQFSDILVSGNTVKEMPNDTDLGKYVRKTSIVK